MTDLDIQIDVPDDDDLGTSVRVLNNNGIPPWFKAAVAFLVGVVLLIMVGAFIVGRNRASDDDTTTTTEQEPEGDTPISSAESSPAVDMTLEAVQAWEEFARTADLDAVAGTFDPEGPQYALFADAASRGETADVELDAANLVQTDEGDITVVSMDLTITGPDGQEVFPFDAVYRPGEGRVWTVVDRRSGGEVAVPPSPAVVEDATGAWNRFADAIGAGDGEAALSAVSADTVLLLEQLTAGGAEAGAETGLDAELEDVLLRRIRAESADQPAAALLAVLDPDQRRGIVDGELGSWTQTAGDRVVATLARGGEQITVVPFVDSGDGWRFDLALAMKATNGADG